MEIEFDDFVRTRLRALLRTATALCDDPHLAEEIVQVRSFAARGLAALARPRTASPRRRATALAIAVCVALAAAAVGTEWVRSSGAGPARLPTLAPGLHTTGLVAAFVRNGWDVSIDTDPSVTRRELDRIVRTLTLPPRGTGTKTWFDAAVALPR